MLEKYIIKMDFEKNKGFILGFVLGVNISFLFFNFGMTYLNINYDFYKKPNKHIL
jgi:hypothetical protein